MSERQLPVLAATVVGFPDDVQRHARPLLARPRQRTDPAARVQAAEPGERRTRKPMPPWDRVKFIFLLSGVIFVVLFWASVVDNPIIPIADAFNEAVSRYWWVLALIVVEGVRQLHYAISEHSAEYNEFWTKKVFGGMERRTNK